VSRQIFGERSRGQAGAGMGRGGGRNILFTVEEAEVGRRRAIERGDIGDAARVRQCRRQRRTGQGGDLIQRETAGVS
jgi:hypothetical protein